MVGSVADLGRACREGPTAEAAVDYRKLGNVLAVGGLLVLVGAVVWWFVFYSNVVKEMARFPILRETGTTLRDLWRCAYSSDGLCALISGGANAVGETPYEPKLFWLGLIALVIGVVIRLSAKSPSKAG